MNDKLSYDRRSVNSILNYLKDKASELSNGRWTDFSSGDIGSVLLGLMATLADMNNFQIDKTASELYLDTAVERTSIMSLLKLVGYEPRHYMSAYTQISLVSNLPADSEYTNQTMLIPAYSTFTNKENTITYTSLSPIQVVNGQGYGIVYEGTRTVTNYTYNQITSDGKIYLADYKIGLNTVELFISGISDTTITRVEDVRFVAGEFAFSVHVNEYAQVYIQLPSYWTDLISETANITVSYLITQGEAGRIGSNILVQAGSNTSLLAAYSITNPEPSTGGYFPETTDELKISAPKEVRTMLTIVTKKDMEDLVSVLPEIAQIKAGDYNDKWTGYKQPTDGPGGVVNDAYKCKVLAVPLNVNETSLYEDKYEYVEKARLEEGQSYTCDDKDRTVITYSSDPDDAPENYLIDDSYKYALKVRIVYKYELIEEHAFTTSAQTMVDYIDERRLASLYMEYEDPKRLTPNIELDIYVNENDLRANTIAANAKIFMQTIYGRRYLSIGQSLYGSVIGRDLLNAFPEITYVEVHAPENNIEVDDDEYIDMYYAKFYIKVNDTVMINEWS